MEHPSIDIERAVAILARRGLRFRPAGSRYLGPCPHGNHRNPGDKLAIHLVRGNVRVGCWACNFDESLPAYICRLNGVAAHGPNFRSAMEECGLPTRTPMLVPADPPSPTHRPDGSPLPDPDIIQAALAEAGIIDLEALSPAPPFFGMPEMPDGPWIFSPRFFRCHPTEERLSLDAQKAIIAALAAMESSPVLHVVILQPRRLFAVWRGVSPVFLKLCYQLGHDASELVADHLPTRTIFHRHEHRI